MRVLVPIYSFHLLFLHLIVFSSNDLQLQKTLEIKRTCIYVLFQSKSYELHICNCLEAFKKTQLRCISKLAYSFLHPSLSAISNNDANTSIIFSICTLLASCVLHQYYHSSFPSLCAYYLL